MNKYKYLFFTALLITHPAFGDSINPPLSFDDCIAETRQNNPELRSFLQTKDASLFQKKVAEAEYLPNLTGSIAGSHSDRDSWGSSKNSNNFYVQNDNNSVLDIGSRASDSSTISGSIAIRQNVFSGFAHEAAVEIAEAGTVASLAELQIANARISSQLKTAYTNVVYWQRYVKLATKIAQRREENLGVVKLRYEGGNENKGSFLQAQALYEQALYEKKQAIREVEAAKLTLAKVLGRSTTDGLVIIDKMPLQNITKYNIEKDLINHPEMLHAKASKESAEAQLKSARSGYYPSVNISAQAGAMDGSRMHDTEDYSVGFDISIPIFTFGRVKNSVSKAKADLSVAQSTQLAKEQELRSSIKNAQTALLSAQDKVKLQQKLLEASTVRAEIGRNKYNIGLLDFENWDIIETELINYQKSALQSEREQSLAEANWEQAIGSGLL